MGDQGDEIYEMDTLRSAADYVSKAGFVDIDLDDRNDWFRELARDEYERLKGPLSPSMWKSSASNKRRHPWKMPASAYFWPSRANYAPGMSGHANPSSATTLDQELRPVSPMRRLGVTKRRSAPPRTRPGIQRDSGVVHRMSDFRPLTELY